MQSSWFKTRPDHVNFCDSVKHSLNGPIYIKVHILYLSTEHASFTGHMFFCLDAEYDLIFTCNL